MDDIVEKFLMEKLEKEINNVSQLALDKALKCKQTPVQTELQGVHLLLKQKTGGAAAKETRKEKIYLLLNLTAEWREQLEKQKLCNPKALLPVDDIVGKLKKIKKELEEPHDKSNTEQQPTDPQVYRWSSQFNLSTIRGFDDKRRIMERLLLDKQKKAIGIAGEAGVGKTALVQQAYSSGRVRQHFLLRIWLCLSRQQKLSDDVAQRMLMLSCPGFECEDQVKRFKRMLRCLGFEDEVIAKIGRSPKRLEVALRRHLSRGRCLVVLDDAWTNAGDDVEMEEANERLLSFLTENLQGTVIVTGRSSSELEKMVGANNLQRLLPLADKDSCWEIFNDACKLYALMALSEEEKQKSRIVEKCEGLPLMARMLGQIGYTRI